MSSAGEGPSRGTIETLVIDPKAENVVAPAKPGSGKQEVDFYNQAGEHYKFLHNQQNLGLLGKLWGAQGSAPTNIAGLIIILCLLLAVVSFMFEQTAELSEARKWMLGFTTSALGFLFGAASKSKSD